MIHINIGKPIALATASDASAIHCHNMLRPI